MTDNRKEFVLAALRCTSLRVKLIEREIHAIGIALQGDFIAPDTALAWAEEVAPGFIGYIPGPIVEPVVEQRRVAA